jgi:glycosyltransferase involved in cell wall biosynthesis
MTKTSVCLIIPVYNEAENLGYVLDDIAALSANPLYELETLVVDGGSKDGTPEIARQRGVKTVQQQGRGYGAACYTGLNNTTASVLVYLDGDYSDPPAAVPQMVQTLLDTSADLVLGIRTSAKAERGALPWHAVLGNRLVVKLINMVYGQCFNDLPSFKAVRREALEKFAMSEMTYGWTTEMLVKAARAGCKITEIQVGYRKRLGGKSKVSGTLKGTVLAAYHLVKTALRYRHWQLNSTNSSDMKQV